MTEHGHGHRTVEHTADITVEAWGPNRAACLEEAVHGLVGSFIDVRDAAEAEQHEWQVEGAVDDADVLVELLSEVIYLLDAYNRVPATVSISADDTGLIARFGLVEANEVSITGAIPKAITYHRLGVGPDEAGTWHARVTVDV